jgi:hypothetical protein
MNARNVVLLSIKVMRAVTTTAVLNKAHLNLSLSDVFDRRTPHILQAMKERINK